MERPQGLIPGSARRGTGKSLPQVISVRFEAPLLKECRLLAEHDGVTLSKWVRSAALHKVRLRHPEWIFGWHCDHLDITGPQGSLSRPSCSFGCEMEPVYEPSRSGEPL